MARGKYEKKIINTHLENFQQQMERSYSQYQEGAYVPIVYYQIDKEKTKLDQSLDVAQNIMGNSSSIRFKKITGVPLYGMISGLNYEIDIEQAFKTTTSSSGYFVPGSVIPSPNDFFSVDRQGLRNHLFRVTSVDFNTANSNKHYQFQYELYQNPTSDITSNVSEEYSFIIENMGSNQNTIIKKKDEYMMELTKDTVDTLIDKYILSYYDHQYDTFTLRAAGEFGDTTKLWNPYVIRFIHEHDLITKYNYDMLTEVHTMEYIEGTYPKWFKDDIWMDSIYNKIDRKIKIDPIDTFTTINKESLTKWVKLPFHHSSETILLDSFANEYQKNYSLLDVQNVMNLPEDTRKQMINLKSIMDTNVYDTEDLNRSNFIDSKYLVELEYFSENSREIREKSNIGDVYYVYNRNNGYIDNVYEAVPIAGEVAPGPEEELLEMSRYFKFDHNFKQNNKGKYYHFLEDGSLLSSWKVMEDHRGNLYMGRFDSNTFNDSKYVANSLVGKIIKDYISTGRIELDEKILDNISHLQIRRTTSDMFYLVPILIYILRKFIEGIQY